MQQCCALKEMSLDIEAAEYESVYRRKKIKAIVSEGQQRTG